MYKACYAQAILRCIILDRMPAGKYSSRFHYFVRSTLQNLTKDCCIHILRESNNIQCGFRLTTHSIDVTQCIRRCYLPKIIWIVCNRRKKIKGLNHCQFVRNSVNSCIIRCFCSNKKIRILKFRQSTKYTCQRSRTYFRCTSTIGGELCKIYLLHFAQFPFCLNLVHL